MKIIDFERRGNVVRFYLGEDNIKDYTGDDWGDDTWEYKASRVYDEYIVAYGDISVPFDRVVLDSSECQYCYSKNDMKNRLVPCIAIANVDRLGQDCGHLQFGVAIAMDDTERVYFGDEFDETRFAKYHPEITRLDKDVV